MQHRAANEGISHVFKHSGAGYLTEDPQASAVPIMARDESIAGIVAQVLCYPVTRHPKFFSTDEYELGSYIQNHDAAIIDPIRMEWFSDHYMPEPTPDWRLSTLLAPSLTDLPPACKPPLPSSDVPSLPTL
jgi:hypothetical protein